MQSFIARHEDKIKGVLSGWDRIRFRGTLRFIANTHGLMNFLWLMRILLKDFKDTVLQWTDTIRATTLQLADQARGPVI